MTATIPASALKSLSASTIAAFSADRREPAWLLELRQTAFANFAALPWPDPKSELWKRLPIADLKLEELTLGAASSEALPSLDALSAKIRALSKNSENGAASARRFIELGRGQVTTVPDALRERDVQWLSLEDAVTAKADQVKAAWKAAIGRAKADKFRSLVLALANGGTCLFVPRGTVLKAPIHTYVAAGGEANSAQLPLNFYFLEEGTETQIWEELVGREDGNTAAPLFVCNLTVIEMKENAKTSLFSLQNWDEGTAHFQFQDVEQKSFSRFNAVSVSLGGRMFRHAATIDLDGVGAENKVLGVLFGERTQNFENWITQNHTAPKTTSDIQYRGALKGSARSFFSGLVYIKKEAQQSDAFQSAKTMLLSPDAKADAIPNLEILADDVKCSHGAAVGPVDEDQKFYLQSRGIDPETAEKAIIEGFFEPVIAEVPSEAVQERLRQFVEEKMKRP